jgi:hypothetical protein
MRWLQFSLRDCFFVVALLCAYCFDSIARELPETKLDTVRMVR